MPKLRKIPRHIVVYAAIGLVLLVVSLVFLLTENPFAPQMALATAVFIFVGSIYIALWLPGIGRKDRQQAPRPPSAI